MTTNIVITLFDNRTGRTWDISEAVYDVEWTTEMYDEAGMLTFHLIKDNDSMMFSEGATVSFQMNGENIFKGFVFEITQTQDLYDIEVKCYDGLRYLKNSDSFVFENKSCDQIFSTICMKFGIPYNVDSPSSFIPPPKTFDAEPLYDMIKWALDQALTYEGKWYIIRDDFGTIRWQEVSTLNSYLLIGEQSGVTEYEHTSSIDEDVYNQIKLYRDNKETGKREIFLVNDPTNMGYWGLLQKYESVDENMNLAQIETLGKQMLSLYNHPVKTLSISCLGYPKVFAGALFKCQLPELGVMYASTWMLAEKVTHTIKNGEHMMDIDCVPMNI